MRLISIDPGSDKTGFAILEGSEHKGFTEDSIELLKSGVIKIKPTKGSYRDKLMSLHNSLWAILQEFKPDVGIIEKTYTLRPQASLVLSKFSGAIALTLALSGVARIEEILSTEWRGNVFGKGNADKEMAKAFYGKEDDNEAEAIGIGEGWFCGLEAE